MKRYWLDPDYKRCTLCRARYFRSNVTRLWVAQAPGHRAGWVKIQMRLCCRCMAADDAQALMRDLDPKWQLPKKGA